MNANGDRQGSLSVDVIQNGFYVPILSYKVEKPNDEQEYKQLPAFDNIIWPVNRKTAPLGYPKPCGFDRELCPPGIADTLGKHTFGRYHGEHYNRNRYKLYVERHT